MQSKPLSAVALGLASISFVAADTTVTINAKSNNGVWEGWGTSLAWWAQAFGDRDDLADIFFTTTTVNFSNVELPGLGLNIVRHNAGASSTTPVGSDSMVVSPSIKPSRQVMGHWIDWNSADPTSSSWNWDIDLKQRSMMQKAHARGADRFELFSNSPMWWMTSNHNPSGDAKGGENIQSWNTAQHAVYLANIAKYAKDNWNITFESVEPLNEPSADWWKADGTQEGCHIDISTQASIIGSLRSELNDRGLQGAFISASDENTYDQAVKTLKSLGDDALNNIGRINVHGYQYGDGDRAGVLQIAVDRGLRLWNSEYGENDATGQQLVSNLIQDFRWLKPTGWVYWQVLDGGGWGVIDADNDAGTVGAANQKYFVLAQFSRHIRDGMQILDGGADNVVAAYDNANEKLVIVAVNWGDAQNLVFDLSQFTQASTDGAVVTRWRTQLGSGDQYIKSTEVTMTGTTFSAAFEQNMVETFEIKNVKI
ncbi:endo-beta-1,6-galactanase [Colletotrichum spaethianum]|uniref:Endo-beta-1,6-galactanase n=1 Tax=Colletotrichum spaethianum TaxID=700344 RepID=A0AA37LAB6_9PEZI|nr:endo-beta-1,6-galactanase [Colletotrichum spaethianum]GKT42944.1 endo-beta-1,6-galactanase [Colletotrichum spaethianum]